MTDSNPFAPQNPNTAAPDSGDAAQDANTNTNINNDSTGEQTASQYAADSQNTASSQSTAASPDATAPQYTPAPQYGAYAPDGQQYGASQAQQQPNQQPYQQPYTAYGQNPPYYQQVPYGQQTPYGQYGQQTPYDQNGQTPYGQTPQYGQPPYGQQYGQYGYQGTPLPQGGYMPPQGNGPVPLDKPWYGIGFVDAIKRFFTKYTVFTGRASRGEFWWAILMYELAALILDFITSPFASSVNTTVSVLWELACIVPFIAVGIRRLHDTNRSGKWILLPAVPFAITQLVDWFWLRNVANDLSGMWVSIGNYSTYSNASLNSSQLMNAVQYSLSELAMPLMLSGICSLVYLISGIVLMAKRSNPEGARFDVSAAGPYGSYGSYGSYGQAGAPMQGTQPTQQYPQDSQYPQNQNPNPQS